MPLSVPRRWAALQKVGASLPPISYVGSTKSGNNVGNVPTGTQAGDVMVALAGVYYNVLAPTITPPAGWTQQGTTQSPVSTNRAVAMYTRVAGASEPTSYTWTFSGSSSGSVAIITLRHVSNASPVNTGPAWNASSTNVTSLTSYITPTVDNCAVVSFVWVSGSAGSAPTVTTYTLGVSGNTGAAGGVGYQIQTAHGYVTGSWSWSSLNVAITGAIALANG